MTTASEARFAPYISSALSTLPAAALRSRGGARCADPEMAAFAELSQPLDPSSWQDLGSIAGSMAVLEVDSDIEPRPPWRVLERFSATIMTFTAGELDVVPDPRLQALRERDLDDIRALALRTGMGDFPARALRFGQHFGVRVDGRLAAMAGRRFVIDDRVEISWVSTDPEYRRLGLASVAVVAVCHSILADGRTPFLIVVDGNPASAMYERLGFTPAETIHGLAVSRVPSNEA